MITLSMMLLPIASLTIPNVDFYFLLEAETTITDISQNNSQVEFEFDADYYCYFETNSYPDFLVADSERIGMDLFTIYVDIGEYKLSQLIDYKLQMNITYHELIVNIDSYSIYFDIDYYMMVVAADGVAFDNNYSISREIILNTAEQFTIQQTYQLNANNYYFDFAPRNQDNSIYNEGYEQGKSEQTQSEEIWQLFDVIFDVTNNILSVEILPGIRLWYLVGIPIFFLLLQFILNLFR